jgi:hypothetical protein
MILHISLTVFMTVYEELYMSMTMYETSFVRVIRREQEINRPRFDSQTTCFAFSNNKKKL